MQSKDPESCFIGKELKGGSHILDLCKGTYTDGHYGNVSEENEQLGRFHQSIVMSGLMCMTILELTIYSMLSIDVHEQNKSMVGKLSQDILTKRHQVQLCKYYDWYIVIFLLL